MEGIKIGIIGAGAVGGVFGALLSEKGYDVEIARRFDSDIVLDNYSNLEIIVGNKAKNILVKSVNGIDGFTTKKDAIFILTKAYDAPGVTKQALKHLAPHGVVISSQNVMHIDEMVDVVGRDRLFALIINWTSIRHNKSKMELTKNGSMVLGNFGDKSAKYLQILKQILCNVAPTEVSTNIEGDIWSRTIINSCISSLGALSGKNLYKTMAVPTARKIFKHIIAEAVALADVKNIKLKNYGILNYYEFVKKGLKAFFYRVKVFSILKRQNGYILSSCMRSIENNQKSEIDFLNGYFAAEGNRLKIDVPTNKRVYDMVIELEKGLRRMTRENLFDYYLLNPKKYNKLIKQGV